MTGGRSLHRYRHTIKAFWHDHLEDPRDAECSRYLEVHGRCSRSVSATSAGRGGCTPSRYRPHFLLLSRGTRRARHLVGLCRTACGLPNRVGRHLPEAGLSFADRRANRDLGPGASRMGTGLSIQAHGPLSRFGRPTSATQSPPPSRKSRAGGFHGPGCWRDWRWVLPGLGSLLLAAGGAGFTHQAIVDGFNPCGLPRGERRPRDFPARLLLG